MDLQGMGGAVTDNQRTSLTPPRKGAASADAPFGP